MSENLFGLTVAADKGLDDLQCQRLLSENRRYQEVMLQYRCALKALESRLEILNEEFSLQHDRNPIESIKSRLKSPSIEKMKRAERLRDEPAMVPKLTPNTICTTVRITLSMMKTARLASTNRPMRLNILFQFPFFSAWTE